MTGFNVMFGDTFDREDHDAWCQQVWDALAEGGVWGIKRCGLIFQKRAGMLVLINSMPHMEGMPITAAQLKQQQDADFALTVQHFGRIGVNVERKQ